MYHPINQGSYRIVTHYFFYFHCVRMSKYGTAWIAVEKDCQSAEFFLSVKVRPIERN